MEGATLGERVAPLRILSAPWDDGTRLVEGDGAAPEGRLRWRDAYAYACTSRSISISLARSARALEYFQLYVRRV